MAKAVLSLEEASKILSQVTMLDAKMNGLLGEIEKQQAQYDRNAEEIKKRLKLEQDNQTIEATVKSLHQEAHDLKNQRDEKVAQLTANGWVVPMPPTPAVRGSLTM